MTPTTVSTTKTPRHEVQVSTAPPMVGARMGATPTTSISRENSRAAASPENRSRTTAMATTEAAAAPSPCNTRSAPSTARFGASTHNDRGHHVYADPGQQWAATPVRVGERADHELPEGQAGQRAGQGQLHRGRRRVQVGGDRRQRRQVHVDGQRTERGQKAEHQHEPKAPSRGQEVAGRKIGHIREKSRTAGNLPPAQCSSLWSHRAGHAVRLVVVEPARPQLLTVRPRAACAGHPARRGSPSGGRTCKAEHRAPAPYERWGFPAWA